MSQSGEKWWQVDLGGSHDIGFVEIFHRTDCCQDRLVGASVIVSPTSDYQSGQVWQCAHIGMAGAQPETVRCDEGTNGRYVTVASAEDFLTICEAMVFSETHDSQDVAGGGHRRLGTTKENYPETPRTTAGAASKTGEK